MANQPQGQSAFLTDVKTLRERARQSLDDGAIMPTYKGDPEKTIELLQTVVATELVCVLRYQMPRDRSRWHHLKKRRGGI
jgi:bacterioferritin